MAVDCKAPKGYRKAWNGGGRETTITLQLTEDEFAHLERVRQELAARSPGVPVTINDAIRHLVRRAQREARAG